MAQRFRDEADKACGGFPIIGKNSEALAVADAVQADSSGWLAVVGTTTKVLGYSTDARTMAGTNQTVAKVKPLYVYAPGVRMQYTADIDCTQTDIGAYADLASATSGSQQLNLAAGSSGQFFVLGFNPDIVDGEDDEIVVEVAEPQVLAFTQD